MKYLAFITLMIGFALLSVSCKTVLKPNEKEFVEKAVTNFHENFDAENYDEIYNNLTTSSKRKFTFENKVIKDHGQEKIQEIKDIRQRYGTTLRREKFSEFQHISSSEPPDNILISSVYEVEAQNGRYLETAGWTIETGEAKLKVFDIVPLQSK